MSTSSETGLAFNGHSMVGALQRVLVCSPRTAGWNQPERTERWRELGFHHAPEFDQAQSQHDALVSGLKNAGAEVVELPPDDQLSLDAVYAHDASLPTDFGLILMRAGKANRVAEARHQGASCAGARHSNPWRDHLTGDHRSRRHPLARLEDVAHRPRLPHQPNPGLRSCGPARAPRR